jgi:hypothetical protein
LTYRNRKLLDKAHDAPCCADFPHNCTAYLGCEPAHSDALMFGRGHGHKSPDWAVAFMCHAAHALITGKPGDDVQREQKFMDWLRSYVKTQNYLWEQGMVKVI